jgi:hypothetical protein
MERSDARRSASPIYRRYGSELRPERGSVRTILRTVRRRRSFKIERRDTVGHSGSPSAGGKEVVRRSEPGPATPASISSPDPAGSNAESSIPEERPNGIKPLTTVWPLNERRHCNSPFVLTAAAAMEADEQAKKETLPADPSAPNPADEPLRALVGAVAGPQTGFPSHHCEAEHSEVASEGVDFHQPASLPRLGIPLSYVREETPEFLSMQKHRCQYCGAEFSRHHDLISYQFTHSEQLRYFCPTCHKGFRHFLDLERHDKSHFGGGEGTYTCGTYGRKFANRDTIDQHKESAASYHNERGSACGFNIEVDPEAENGVMELDAFMILQGIPRAQRAIRSSTADPFRDTNSGTHICGGALIQLPQGERTSKAEASYLNEYHDVKEEPSLSTTNSRPVSGSCISQFFNQVVSPRLQHDLGQNIRSWIPQHNSPSQVEGPSHGSSLGRSGPTVIVGGGPVSETLPQSQDSLYASPTMEMANFIETSPSGDSTTKGEMPACTPVGSSNHIDTSSDDSATNLGEAEQAIISAVARRLVDDWATQGTTSIFGSTAGIRNHARGAHHANFASKHVLGQRLQLSRAADTLKRARDEDGSDEDEANKRSRKRRRSRESNSNEITPNMRLLACPYQKYDPGRYSERNIAEKEYRGCASCYLSDISRLK